MYCILRCAITKSVFNLRDAAYPDRRESRLRDLFIVRFRARKKEDNERERLKN